MRRDTPQALSQHQRHTQVVGKPFDFMTSTGSAGINPSLNIPGGLLSFAILRAFTKLGDRFGWGGLSIFGIFTPQVR